MHICGIQKNGTYEPVCRAGIEMQMQRTDLWTPCRMERVRQRQQHQHIYTNCVQQIASANLLNSTGSSAWCSVMTQRGGKETQEAGEIYIYMYVCTQLIHIVVQQKLKPFFKVTSSSTFKKRIKGVIQGRFFWYLKKLKGEGKYYLNDFIQRSLDSPELYHQSQKDNL